MRVLFIRPNSGYYVLMAPHPPLASLALASFLQSKGHTVRIFDRLIDHGLIKTVREFQPDAVAVTLIGEATIPDAMEVSKAIKRWRCEVPVFWGGHLPSAIPELAARAGCVDYVGISEGEYTLLELLEVAEGKRARETVPGIAYVDENGEYHRTADRPFADLADFPPLDYSLIPVERFLAKYPFANRVFYMSTSKGCPFNCAFCFNKEYHHCQRRAYPREVIFQQIKTLVESYRVDGIQIYDEIFGTDPQDLREFCQSMKNMKLNLTWASGTAVGILSREDLEMMYDAGCRTLAFGLESGSAEMRRKIKKPYDASKLDETFHNCREIGISTWGLFIVGLPDETPEQVRETVRLCLRLHMDVVDINFFTPIPGSQLYRELVAVGRLNPSKTLEGMEHNAMEHQHLYDNYSCIPDKELQVIQKFFLWDLVFGKKKKAAGTKRFVSTSTAIMNMLHYFRNVGLRGLVRGLWESAKLFFTVAWYAHAYPSIRKKYGLYAKNYGRTDWDDA